ncbi:hypothetical protein pb186bvf_000711 [Paramecium bursaria]
MSQKHQSTKKAYFNLVLSQQNQIEQLHQLVRRQKQRIRKLKQLVGQQIKVEDQSDDSSVYQLSASQPQQLNNNFLEQILAQSKEKKRDKLSVSSDEKVKQCKICNKTYINKRGYMKHFRRMHQNQQTKITKRRRINKIDPVEIVDDIIVVKPEQQ